LLDAIMPLVSLQARKLHVRVVMEVAESCSTVLCDRTMVEQVLLNLCRNGMQAMREANTLSDRERVLSLRVTPADDHWVMFSVTDHGVGISAAVADKLFTPFFTTKAEGMGLGLSLCRTVIEQHGGCLGHVPATPRGTVFSFTLPASLAIAPTAQSASPQVYA
jgi:two-component system sensor histidine kinase DctS